MNEFIVNKKYIAAIICLSVVVTILSFMLYSKKHNYTVSQKPLDAENFEGNAKLVSMDKFYTRSKSFKSSKKTVFGPSWSFTDLDLNLNDHSKIIFNYALHKGDPSDEILFIFSVYDITKVDNNQIHYEAFRTSDNKNIVGSSKDGEWIFYRHSIVLNGDYSKDHKVAFYFWDKDHKKQPIYIDDLNYVLE